MPHALGMLQLLWDYTAQYQPAGNIGVLTNDAIARVVYWEADPKDLIKALIKTRWLDKNADHRLIVHDWPEHCEDTVHRRLAREGKYFSDGTAPKVSRLSAEEKKAAQAK